MAESVSELQGTGLDATLWALFFQPLRRNTEIKVVWRMTGAGDLSMRATGPGGATVTPVWGPESHLDSTWHKPGDEWGTGSQNLVGRKHFDPPASRVAAWLAVVSATRSSPE